MDADSAVIVSVNGCAEDQPPPFAPCAYIFHVYDPADPKFENCMLEPMTAVPGPAAFVSLEPHDVSCGYGDDSGVVI